MIPLEAIAKQLTAELKGLTREVEDLERNLEVLRQKKDANAKWLAAHGFRTEQTERVKNNARQFPEFDSDSYKGQTEVTTSEIAVDILQDAQRPMTMVELRRAVAERKKVHKNTVEVAVRRHPELFVIEKNGRTNVVKLKERSNGTSS